jgi:hypothetical protein
VIVAVNVTDCPTIAGFGEAVKAVDVGVRLGAVTVSAKLGDVDPAKVELPEYIAVRLSDPTARLVVLKAALPDATFAVPS